jgi:hypothetical protein
MIPQDEQKYDKHKQADSHYGLLSRPQKRPRTAPSLEVHAALRLSGAPGYYQKRVGCSNLFSPDALSWYVFLPG